MTEGGPRAAEEALRPPLGRRAVLTELPANPLFLYTYNSVASSSIMFETSGSTFTRDPTLLEIVWVVMMGCGGGGGLEVAVSVLLKSTHAPAPDFLAQAFYWSALGYPECLWSFDIFTPSLISVK